MLNGKILEGRNLKFESDGNDMFMNNLVYIPSLSHTNSYFYETSYDPIELTDNELESLITEHKFVGEDYSIELLD